MPRVDEQIVEGLTAFGEVVADAQLARFAALTYKSVADAFDRLVQPDEACVLAFPAMIVRPDIRTQAFVAIFGDRAIVAWRNGVVRKRTEHVVIRFDDVTSAEWDISSRSSTRGATLLKIDAGETSTIALPLGERTFANMVRDAFLAASHERSELNADALETPTGSRSAEAAPVGLAISKALASPPKPTKAEKLEAKAARLREAAERRAADTAAGRPPQRRGFVIATAVLAVVCAALVALLLVLYFSWQDQRDKTSARDDAVAAAKSFALDFGAYDYQHLDTEFQEVAQKMTPGFAKSYLQTSDKLKPTFEQYKTQVTAHIQGWGVTSSSTSKATVIVFLDQTVHTSQSTTPRIDRNRLEIDLVHTGGKWLVSKLLAK
jgi:Mce-associated membrane protein